MNFKLSVFTAALVILCSINGCSSGTGTSTPALTGKVADGYLVNATVFLDKNGNYLLDVGEPFTVTDQNGAYTLNVEQADVGKYPIVALAIKGQTIDKDTGQQLQSSFVLSMPPTAVSGTAGSNFISPLSTEIRELMETGKFTTIQQAMDQLCMLIGVPAGTDVLGDYVETNNTTLHTLAQNMATLMGRQMTWVFGTNGTISTIDINRYRAMVGTIYSSLPAIKEGANVQAGMDNIENILSSMALNNINLGQPFRNMSSVFRVGQPLSYQIIASIPYKDVSSSVDVFRSEKEWSDFWNGQAPVLPIIDFSKNYLIAVVYHNPTCYFTVTGLQSATTGVSIRVIESISGVNLIDTIQVITPDGQVISTPTASPYAQLIVTPIFSGDASLDIIAKMMLP